MDEAWMEALRELGLQNCAYTLLQEKEGIRVARVWRQGIPYIIKFFQAADFRREIANYRILAALGVPTLKVHAQTSSALLLEDAAHSPLYRLGTPEDLRDSAVARRIADWYRLLHQKGYAYAARHGADLYDEASVFTREAIAQIQQKTGTQGAPAWKALEERFAAIVQLLQSVPQTLTYNDFYFTNLAVAKDLSSAMMFDYNLLGRGYAYADVRNVTASLEEEARQAFLAAYGALNPLEARLDRVVSTVVTLHFACQRKTFPTWAAAELERVSTSLESDVLALF